MSDKDKIKELFQKELGNYQAKVDPGLWNGIQAGLGSTGAAGIISSIGLTGKIIIGASIATVITVGTIFMVNKPTKTTSENERFKVEELTTNNQKEVKVAHSETAFNTKKRDRIQPGDKEAEHSAGIKNSDNVPSNPILNPEENPVVTPPVLPIKDNEEKNASQNSKPTLQNIGGKVNSKPSNDNPEEKAELKANLSKVKIQVVQQKNQFVSFSAIEVPDEATIRWNFGDGEFGNTLNPEHFYTEAGNYNVELTVLTNQQKITKTVQISVHIKGEIGILPNAFTPNGDGRNDIFFIESKHLKSFQLTVMDKNQNVVYSTNDPNFQWNGIDKYDNPVKEGDYIYIIIAEDEAGNTINKYQKLTIKR